MTRILLVTPPFTQLNTAYPATTYLTGYLRRQGHTVAQADLSLETALALFSRPGLSRLFDAIRAMPGRQADEVRWFLERADDYLDTVDPVVRFLQGRDLTLAHRICHGHLLPEGPRFAALEDDDWAFGTLGVTDRARHLATLYLDDLSDLVRATLTPHFGLTRYADRLATAATSFDPIFEALHAPPTLIDDLLAETLTRHLEAFRPSFVGFTVPFPGNLYGALRGAAAVKRFDPSIRTALGGGYANTELRSLNEPRLFDAIDFVTLDDGERPMLCLLEHLAGTRPVDRLRRTFVRQEGQVVYQDGAIEPEVPLAEWGAPTYDGLPIDRYLSVLEVLNPMHRLWSDGRWNKLTLAHGCYWKKCSFCDVSLDYIGRYEPAQAADLADRIDALVAETGQTGFHFVDEAAPPLLLRDLALELLERGRTLSWWGNIRFEKTFTPDLTRLLASSGCIAVSGGLEVASDRLLGMMKKGVTVAQVARVASAFTQAGVMVHAYLMYGFPTETLQELVDSLERVRQLFDAGVIQSGFWHRFVATAHSPIGLEPAEYRIRITGPAPGAFANNDLEYDDPEGCDADRYGPGLDRAVFNYMYGQGIDQDVRRWFDEKVPGPKVSKTLIAEALEAPSRPDLELARAHRAVWLGQPVTRQESREARARKGGKVDLLLPGRQEEQTLKVTPEIGRWLEESLNSSRPRGRKGRPYPKLEAILAEYPGGEPLERFLEGPVWRAVREAGLVVV